MTNGSPDRRRPTLSAVAAVAGTSVPTVSKVLRGGTDVSPETRLKVGDSLAVIGTASQLASLETAAMGIRRAYGKHEDH